MTRSARSHKCQGADPNRGIAFLCLEQLEQRLTPATYFVSDAATLQAAVAQANQDFTPDAIVLQQGAYNLSSQMTVTTPASLLIVGNGQTINAGGHSRAFQINPGSNVTLQNLTITNGVASDDGNGNTSSFAFGGAILDLAGTLTLSGVNLQGNTARAALGASALGGGLFASTSTVTISGCNFLNNQALAGSGSASASTPIYAAGGSIYIAYGSSVSISNSTIANSLAQGGNGVDGTAGPKGSTGGGAYGGGLALTTGGTATVQVSLDGLVVAGNTAHSGKGGDAGPSGTSLPSSGGDGAFALGGGIYLQETGGTVTITGSRLTYNQALGGTGGMGGANSALESIGGTGGTAGGADGGGLYANASNTFASGWSLNVSNTVVASNSVTGGTGGAGGAGGPEGGSTGAMGIGGGADGGGMVLNGGTSTAATSLAANITACQISGNVATGGSGGAASLSVFTDGNGDVANGGGVYVVSHGSSTAALNLSSSILASNTATGGTGANGGAGGGAYGGGLALSSASTAPQAVTLTNVQVTGNTVQGGQPDTSVPEAGSLPSGADGLGGGIYSHLTAGTVTIASSALASNKAVGGTGLTPLFGSGGTGGTGAGGGLYADASNTVASGWALNVNNTSVADNSATGGTGGNPIFDGGNGGTGGLGNGGGIGLNGGSGTAGTSLGVNITAARVSGNVATGGSGGPGVDGGVVGSDGTPSGGGVYLNSTGTSAGVLTLSGVLVQNNTAQVSSGASAVGGGLSASNGTVTITGSTFASNQALAGSISASTSPPIYAAGGSIYIASGSPVSLFNSTITKSLARGGNGVDGTTSGADGNAGADAFGGGLAISSGDAATLQVSLANLTVTGNSAQSGKGGQGGPGAIGVNGGNGGSAGTALGGGVYLEEAGGTVTMAGSVVNNNAALGNDGGNGGPGDSDPGGDATSSGGASGNGGSAEGGGLYAGANLYGTSPSGWALNINTTTVAGNNANGGNGGTAGDTGYNGKAGNAGSGGAALGGGISLDNGTLTGWTDNITASTISNNSATGGTGGTGGISPGAEGGGGVGGTGGFVNGGGVYVNSSVSPPAASSGSLALTNSTLAFNTATGGNGGDANQSPQNSNINGGKTGAVAGGGLSISGPDNISFLDDTVAYNQSVAGVPGQGSPTGSPGTIASNNGGGVYLANTGTSAFANTLVAKNTVSSNGPSADIYGTATSTDHDLIGIADGANNNGFNTDKGDQFGTAASPLDPQLAATLAINGGFTLANNSGLTQTLALLVGSPAVNAGDNTVGLPATDQRGLARIIGPTVDVGAFELQPIAGPVGQVVVPVPGHATANERYVESLFHAILGRASDPAGLAGWVNLLNSTGSRDAVVRSLWESNEHRGDEVDYYYQHYLGRTESDSERTAWVNAFNSGMREADVQVLFLTGPEFQKTYSRNSAFVTALYNLVLARASDPESSDFKFWVNALTKGTYNRAQVALLFINSQELANATVNQLDYSWLARPAGPSDLGSYGNTLQNPGQDALEDVAIAILMGSDYYNRAVS